MGKADLHIHTNASDGTFSPYQMLEYVSAETDIALLAVTDHDEIHGALEAAALADQFPGLEVIPGIEVSTFDGHLIGLWVETAFPVLRSAGVDDRCYPGARWANYCPPPHVLVDS